MDVFCRFLRNQTELQTLQLALLASEVEYTKIVFFNILSTCSKLVDFRISCAAVLKLNEFFRMLQIISKSKLECLMLWLKDLSVTDEQSFDHDSFAYLTPLTNNSLRTLKLEVPVLDDYCLPILKHLELAVVSDKILQTIFQYHVRSPFVL